MGELTLTIFKTIVIPELARWLANCGSTTMPTEAEILAQMTTIHDSIVNAGNAFLASKGQAPIVQP